MKKIDTRERMNKVICLKDELDEFMQYIGLDAKMQEIKIFDVWRKCVGETINKFSTPVGLRKNTLLISVENAIWRFELSLKKQEILKSINRILSEMKIKATIKDIFFV